MLSQYATIQTANFAIFSQIFFTFWPQNIYSLTHIVMMNGWLVWWSICSDLM